MSKKNLIVGQSGGPTAVINSSLYGVVSDAKIICPVKTIFMYRLLRSADLI